MFNKQLNKWIVKEFMVNQNHPLVEQKNTQFLQSHMVMKNANKAQLSAMCDVDLRTSQIMDYMVVDIVMLTLQKNIYITILILIIGFK